MKRRTPIKRSLKPLKRTRLKPVSDKRRKEMAQYSEAREVFMKHRPMCEAWLKLNGFSQSEMENIQANAVIALWEGRQPAVIPASKNEEMILLGLPKRCPFSYDLHHTKKRGKHYLDVSTWMAVSRQIHRLIHDAPKWARAEGLLA